MESITRRGALRIIAGATGAMGAAAVAGPGSWESASARDVPSLAPRAVISAGATLIGMSAPAAVWGQRVREVGPGLGARRIFADLTRGPDDQVRLVEQAHAAGMLPVVSYKVGADAAGAAAGRLNAVADRAAARLASFGKATAVAVCHEPYGDLTPAQYAAISTQLVPIFKRGQLRVGPILNGYLLDSKQSTFASYCPNALFGLWNWFGIDTYESGTMAAPGSYKPADRLPALAAYLRSRGHGALPIGVGEYNGYSATSLTAVGNALFNTPNVWCGCVWNNTGPKGVVLSGARLAAFRTTLADPRCGVLVA
jgi:hypothetical protein